MSRRSSGFTIVELMVAIGVSSILVVSVVAMFAVFLQQGPKAQARNEMATNLQNALERINDDVRRGTNVALYNMIPDANAPTSLTGEYASVPGPDSDPNNYHTWRIGLNRLIINQTPVDSAGNPIYTDADHAAGDKNVIIYYVHNNALYRRTVAVPTSTYADNTARTTTCPRVAQGGCQASDIKVLDNLKASLGDDAFKVTYYNRSGSEIQNRTDSASGPVPDYTAFSQTRSVAVAIATQSGPVAGGEPVELANSMRMQIRGSFTSVPPDEPAPPVPPVDIGTPGLMAGPGGLIMSGGHVNGGDAYVMGRVMTPAINLSGQIGGNLGWLGGMPPTSGPPINLFAANIACGTTDFPVYCTGQQPIQVSGAYFGIYGGVCATGQTSSSKINAFGGLPGLKVGCISPTVNLPPFDKASFVAKMKDGTGSGAAHSCNSSNQVVNLAGNKTYDGTVSIGFYCTGRLNGSIYIKGDLRSSSYGKIVVSESVGAVRPVVVVNGKIDLRGQSVVPNSLGTTPYFISFHSANSACSNSDSCTTLSGADLKATLDALTASCAPGCSAASAPAIYVHGVSAPGSTFYAYFGEVANAFYATVGAFGGQRVYINGPSSLNMDAGL